MAPDPKVNHEETTQDEVRNGCNALEPTTPQCTPRAQELVSVGVRAKGEEEGDVNVQVEVVLEHHLICVSLT